MTMKDSHAEKGAHNQALLREVNERIEKLGDDAAHPEFLCECADTNCVEMIQLSIAEYESIRSSPVRFPIKLGHDYPEFERVVEENEHYIVVEKFVGTDGTVFVVYFQGVLRDARNGAGVGMLAAQTNGTTVVVDGCQSRMF